MSTFRKYPRTPHIDGSRRQPGDEDLSSEPFASLHGLRVVVEEKIDGANAGISFADGRLQLQSRGHVLTGGARERHFNLFKRWAICFEKRIHEVLGERYVMYGEWVYAKHTVFYDTLPHYFLEFDILDLKTECFLDTPSRSRLIEELPVVSVPVIDTRSFRSLAELRELIGRSLYKSEKWRNTLAVAVKQGECVQFGKAVEQTDPSDEAEGLYIKLEEDGKVRARYKFIRPSFSTMVINAGDHWLDRPIVQNCLAPGVDIFGVL